MQTQLKKAGESMDRRLEHMRTEFSEIRAGRANPRVLDKITVDYYGVESPLNQVANIQVPEARMITIQPWETNMLKEIERAINMSDLGINPQSDGKLIRLVFPQLTEERRKELAREVSQLGEQSKVSIRNVRREGIDTYSTDIRCRHTRSNTTFWKIITDCQQCVCIVLRCSHTRIIQTNHLWE